MTIDERIQALAMHLEILTGMPQDFEKRVEAHMQRMTQYSADVKDAIARLANIAAAHDQAIHDHDQRIEKLES